MYLSLFYLLKFKVTNYFKLQIVIIVHIVESNHCFSFFKKHPANA